MTKIKFKEGNNWVDIGLEYYPIGAIYQSTSNTSPSSLFGGTWTEITDKFLLAAGTTYAAASTGGAATVTLDSTMIPSHTHSVGAHSHGLNSHTHSLSSHTHELQSHYHSLNGHTHDYGSYYAYSAGDHTHNIGVNNNTKDSLRQCGHEAGGYGLTQTSAFHNRVIVDITDQSVANRYIALSAGGHSHSVYGSSGASWGNTGGPSNNTSTGPSNNTSGAASGSTANSTAFDSGATGGGGAHNNMPPYLAVYTWQRVA